MCIYVSSPAEVKDVTMPEKPAEETERQKNAYQITGGETNADKKNRFNVTINFNVNS